ncbi:TetR/AcrR family transcriptional regulator [Nocardia jiangsuensis]|uniref:TetR/AcrR family transcriptional regulator n=1 Tax=Nocardia jiangsuensis TaxID=1691563 RepID=A0ABV8DMP1_9NOCA
MTRRYEMTARAKAREQTREAILDAAIELFVDAWYDEVTIADVAAAAGVSSQTVVNHFGSKIGLYVAGLAERFAPAVRAQRSEAVPGDVESIVRTAVRDYERTGEGTWRLLALAERMPELLPIIEDGHRSHRDWVETVFAAEIERRPHERDRFGDLLVVVLNVGTWRSLRREQGLSQEATVEYLITLVGALLK